MQLKSLARKIANKYGKNRDEVDDIEIICLESVLGKESLPIHKLFVIMKSKALDFLKSEKAKSRLIRVDEKVSESGIYDLIFTNEALNNLLSQVSEREQIVIKLLIEGYTNEEIGDKLDLSKTTITTLILENKEKWESIFYA